MLKAASTVLLRRVLAPTVRCSASPAWSTLSRRSFCRGGSMDTMESGTKKYMSLYPEGSSDGSTFQNACGDVSSAVLE